MSEDSKNEALASLVVLLETCQSALVNLVTPSCSTSNIESAPVDVLRKDAISLHRLIHTSTTRLSVSLGKPPPSYPIALVPLKDLTSQVGQLVSCTLSFPPGILRKEVVWAAEETIQALETLVEHFESLCRKGQDKTKGDQYLAKTGAVHDAVVKAEKLSDDEAEAFQKAWKVNGESLEDSLKELKEMMENKSVEEQKIEDDGWDELGEGFGEKLGAKEMERVKKIYPLLRFTTLLHQKILSHHVLKPAPSQPHSEPHLISLLTFSNSLPVATDDLVSALYAPQDVEEIQEAAQLVHQLTQDLVQELGASEVDGDKLAGDLARLQLGSGSQSLAWFNKCFSQINTIYNGLCS